MSPFREVPPAELGPLDVGLERAAREARARIPRGGRLIAANARTAPLHAAGALGSAGFLVVLSIGALAWLMRWAPETASDVALCVAAVIAGGMSLAAVLRALDRRAGQPTESGAVVGRAACLVVQRLGHLATGARTSPATFGGRRVAALRRALFAAKSPEIARWIPADVLGRAELLLARAIARHAGARWANDAKKRAEVTALLESATQHLAEPHEAEADIAAIKRRVHEPERPRLPVARYVRPIEDDAEADALVPLHARARS